MQQVSFSMVLNMLKEMEIQLSLLTEPSFLNVDGSGFILERARRKEIILAQEIFDRQADPEHVFSS